LPLCTHCHAELGPGVTDRCPSCGKPPWANPAAQRAFREGLVGFAPPAASASASTTLSPPGLPADVTQFYLTAQGPALGSLVYHPGLLGVAKVIFGVDKRKGLEYTLTLRLLAVPGAPGHPIDWAGAEQAPKDLATGPVPGAGWASVPAALDTGSKLKALER